MKTWAEVKFGRQAVPGTKPVSFYSPKDWVQVSDLLGQWYDPREKNGLVNWHVERAGADGTEIYTETLSREEIES